MLALRIDFLNGVYHAADPTAHSDPEWPPHPDRIFQALVAAAYGAGLNPSPLKELEGICPELIFGDTRAVLPATVYVPAAYKAPQSRVGKFDPMIVGIHDPVYVVWSQVPDELNAPISRIAAAVTYLGRAKTPVDLALVAEVPRLPHHLVHSAAGDRLLRVPQPGRLAELDSAFAAGRRAAVASMLGYTDMREDIPRSPWGELLALRPDQMIDIRRAAQLATSLRAAVLSRAGDGASSLLHGHAGDHAAWAIIPDAGHPYARGHVLGLGLWLPNGIDDPARTACALPLMQVDHLNLGGRHIRIGMQPAHQPTPKGLWRRTWSRPARAWASVTPVVFDRHPKRRQSLESAMADSAEMAGYPRPIAIELSQSSPFKGVPLAHEFRPRSSGRWIHVVLNFAQPVAGPVLLGKDRHFGMGLMRPLEGDDAAI